MERILKDGLVNLFGLVILLLRIILRLIGRLFGLEGEHGSNGR